MIFSLKGIIISYIFVIVIYTRRIFMINNVIILIMISLVLVDCNSDYLDVIKRDDSKQVDIVLKKGKDISFSSIGVDRISSQDNAKIKLLKEELNGDEKSSLGFLEKALKESRLGEIGNVITHTEKKFGDFLLYLGVVKLREILVPIMQTLAAKREVETALLNYNGAKKSEFEKKLKEEENLYLNMLKLDANSDSFDTMYNSLVKNSNAYKFMYLKSVIGP